MAKSKKKSKSKSVRSTAPAPDPKNEAATLALYRWYIVTLEQVLLEAYATTPTKSAQYIEVMRGALKDIYKLGKKPKSSMSQDDCGCDPGWECCADGLCAPMCSFDA